MTKHTALFILVGQLSATTTQLLSSQESAFSSQPSTELEAAPVHHNAILNSLCGVDMENDVVPETQEEHPQQEKLNIPIAKNRIENSKMKLLLDTKK